MYFLGRHNQSLSVVLSGAADGPSCGLEGRHPMMHTAAVSVLSARVCGGVVFSFVGIPEQGSMEFLVTPLVAHGPKAGIMSAFTLSHDNVSGSGAQRSIGPAQRAASQLTPSDTRFAPLRCLELEGVCFGA